MKASTIQLTLAECRRRGWYCEKTETWNSFAKVRKDLLGFADVLALPPDHSPLLIQTTTRDNAAARRTKIGGLETARLWLEGGGEIEVWTWAKRKREVDPNDRRRRKGVAQWTLFVSGAVLSGQPFGEGAAMDIGPIEWVDVEEPVPTEVACTQ